MKDGKAGRAALMIAGAALALGTAGCNQDKAKREEYKAQEAKAMKAAADDRAVRRVGYVGECVSAFKWKKAALASAGVGSVDLYIKHYRGEMEKTLGDTIIPAADGAPELSATTIDPYLDWAYDRHVKTIFTSGRDFDGDGTVTPKEANAQGNARVAACIQQAAEAGVGPLAGPDMTARMFKMDALRARLDKSN